MLCLAEWCTTHDFAIANTFTAGSIDDHWTYKKATIRKQLDYILVGPSLRKNLLKCKAEARIDIGSDHRPVFADFSCKGTARKKKRRRRDKTWAIDTATYKNALDRSMEAAGSGQSGCDEKVKSLEKCMLEAAALAQNDKDQDNLEPVDAMDEKIKQLIAERRRNQGELSLDPATRTAKRKQLCKEIQKLTRQSLRERKAGKISEILGEFRGLKQIAAIKGSRIQQGIKCILDSEGAEVTDAREIADVFATFYEELYKSRMPCAGPGSHKQNLTDFTEKPFTNKEWRDALAAMKNHKAKDEAGIIAEMLKDGSQRLLVVTLDVFNDILVGGVDAPLARRSAKLVVIFKKGDPKAPTNYRPIAILPILYKLFSRMLCERMTPYIMKEQSVDQAAYRKHFSTEDRE